MKALISPQENNRILEVVETLFPVAFPLFWIECPSNCTTNWTYDGLNFLEPKENTNYISTEEKLQYIREERDKRLLASDYTQLQDVIALNGEQLTAQWQTYRQALRDMINESLDLDNPVFPIPPV